MKLTGRQIEQMSDAIREAFTVQQLRRMLRFDFDLDLADVSLATNYQEIVFELVDQASREEWAPQLLLAARRRNPGNSLLQALASELGVAPAPGIAAASGAVSSPLPAAQLERIITDNSFLDVVQWRTRLGEIEGRLCRVEIDSNKGRIYGTGFLVGPDALITNYHVMESVIEGEAGRATAGGLKATSKDVALRFDYKRLADGVTLHPGTVHRLAPDWLIDASPPSSVDTQPDPKTGAPRPDELDYALLRLDGPAGSQPIGDGDPRSPARGWMPVPPQRYDFGSSQALFIVQHPDRDPLQLVLDTDADIKENTNGTRVTYRTNTLPGSSGSPCFSLNWELVALHHSGDPNFDPAHKPRYNEGIPFWAIRSLVEHRNRLAFVDGRP
jgi:hypothetical protein